MSVIIPTFNRADCLAASVESVLAQTYQNLEIVVVDDGSADATQALVRERWGKVAKVRYLYQRNRGVSAARNLGLRNAAGEYVALLDSDDTWMPWKLEAQLACLAEFPRAGMVWSDMQAVDVHDRVIAPRHLRNFYDAYRWFSPDQLFSSSRSVSAFMARAPGGLEMAIVRSGNIFSPMIMGNLVHTSTVMLRRSRLEQLEGFDESMRTGEDYDFHLRTCRAGPVAFLDAATVNYRCGRTDRLTRPELTLEIGLNFLRTIEPVIARDRASIRLPAWMIRRSRADGHQWVGEAALAAGLNTQARTHLAKSLVLRPWQPRTAMLLAGASVPPTTTNALRKGVHRVKYAWRSVKT